MSITYETNTNPGFPQHDQTMVVQAIKNAAQSFEDRHEELRFYNYKGTLMLEIGEEQFSFASDDLLDMALFFIKFLVHDGLL